MEAKRCYYEVLEVSRDADENLIKKAYRQMAMRFHPDRNPGDSAAEERFKECSEAYAVLIDPEQRHTYDRLGHAGLNGHGMRSPFGQQRQFEDIFSGFTDILGDIFGHGGQRAGGPRRQRGADLRVELSIAFDEAIAGTRRDVTFERHDVCDPCDGSGAKPGTRPESCSACSGSGRIARQQGFFMVQTTCPVCRGVGQLVKERCKECGGDGARLVQRTLSVKVPAGIDDGMRLRVSGEGETGGKHGIRGDLAIYVRVAGHPVFQREGANIHLGYDVTFSQAVLGADVTVPTVSGEEAISIPSGTQSGTVVRLRNRGAPRVDGSGRGDQFVTLNVVVPSDLTADQRALMDQLRAAGL